MDFFFDAHSVKVHFIQAQTNTNDALHLNMLPRTLIVLLISISGQSLLAQTEFGFSAGVNLSNGRDVLNDQRITQSYLTRLSAGADVAHYFDENWGVQSGLYYSGKGWRERSLNYDTVVVRLNYLELPLKLSYRFSESSEKAVTVNGGVYAAYGLNGKTTFRNSPELSYDPFKEKGYYKRFDFGYVIEGGYRIKNNYGVRASFSSGLLALRRPDDKLKNFLFNFSFCFVLKGTKNP